MSEGPVFSPSHDCLTTPKESLKTPKFREFHEMSSCLASLKSPRDVDSINTPLPLPSGEPLLSTPTLGTPRTADPWQNIFTLGVGSSPLALASNCSSPTTPTRGGGSRDPRPSDLPLESNIGLSSPHDGVLAKRRKLKNLNSSHSRSVESDSNSCDTPTTDSDSLPRDLSKKTERERSRSDSSPPAPEEPIMSPRLSDLDRVRDRVGAFAISTSPSWKFKHPKDVMAHPSPLAMPSPNWCAVSRLMSKDSLALQTPKVLDNFVFDVLPPNTPNTPKVNRERSPEHSQPLNYEKRATAPPTPPPPYPEDLSVQKPQNGLYIKQEPTYPDYQVPLSPTREVKEEPAAIGAPRDFPPYYLAPGINPQHFQPSYRGGDRPASPPASPPAISSQYQRQFYNMPRHPALSSVLAPNYEGPQHGPTSHWWGHGGHELAGQHNGHLAQQAGSHLDKYWRHPEPVLHGLQSYSNLKPSLDKVKCEQRLSTESQDYSMGPEGAQGKKKGARKARAEESNGDGDPNQPPKKKGKKKEKDTSGGPKRVFICPHCQRSYDWNYNLNRHLKYECGKENAFMCSKCGRRFPHKQNCVYHLKRKHKIVCETIDQYVSAGLVVFQGSSVGSQGTSETSPAGEQQQPGNASNLKDQVASLQTKYEEMKDQHTSNGSGMKLESSVSPPPNSASS